MLFDGDSREFIHVLSSPRASSGRQSRGCHGDALIATRSPRCCKSSSARPKTNVRLAGQAKALRKSSLAKENILYHNIVYYISPATSWLAPAVRSATVVGCSTEPWGALSRRPEQLLTG